MSTVTELSSNYDLEFPRSGVTDYAVIDRMYDNLTEVAVAVWIKTDDHENYGTVLSYATPEFDNALCLTDYNGWVIGIATRRSVYLLSTSVICRKIFSVHCKHHKSLLAKSVPFDMAICFSISSRFLDL